MTYPTEFGELLNSTTETYIGQGNPNSNILFLGQEPAIEPNREAYPGQYNLEIKGNIIQWKEHFANCIGYASLADYQFSPLHPYPKQKFQKRYVIKRKDKQIKCGEEGTAPTWYKYQSLINRIFQLYADKNPISRNDFLDFHRYSFHSDMSAVGKSSHYLTNEGNNSVLQRMAMFKSDFFKHFPIVIADVGHFPAIYDKGRAPGKYFYDTFEVECNTPKRYYSRGNWYFKNIRQGVTPQLLLHCPHVIYLSNNLLNEMAEEIVKFAHSHDIDILPKFQ